jgi:hypothetical protein
MTHPRFQLSGRPWWLRVVLRGYEFLASLQLAVVLIVLFTAVLVWATFLDHFYGDSSKAVFFGIYNTWWFAALNVLLGVNVLAAALIRFPWKRSQTGFLITHAGILVLMFGSLLTALRGIDANLPVYEGQASWRAFTDRQNFQLAIHSGTASAADERSDGDAQIVRVPFVPGPFNWESYSRLTWLPGETDRLFVFPWALARPTQGVVYQRDGVSLEVLDYYSDSRYLSVPQLKLFVQAAAKEPEPVTLSVRGSDEMHAGNRPFGMGQRVAVPAGPEVAFWMTGDEEEAAAFRDNQPEGDLGPIGQIVLRAGSRKFSFAVDKLEKQEEQALGDTGLVIDQVRFQARFLGVQFRVRKGDEPPEQMFLFSQLPEFNRHDYRHRLFGEFWFNPAAADRNKSPDSLNDKLLAKARSPRIDILQTPGAKLVYRACQAGKVVESGLLPADGSPLVLWSKAASGPVTLRVAGFTPAARPDLRAVPLPFSRDKSRTGKRPQVRVRVTVDGNQEEFWLAGSWADADESGATGVQRKVVQGRNRSVAISVGYEEIDVGFQVFLHKFQRKLDPGTSHAWYYASLVDIVDRHQPGKTLQKDVTITLNEPIDFSDPITGRSFRLYQASFNGPFKPGDPEYEHVVRGQDMREQVFLSQFSANHDPGRGLKYVGSFMITVGIFMVFYLKAYFFRRHGAQPSR